MAIGGVVINFAAKTRDAITDIDKLTRSLGDTDEKSKGLGGTMKKGLAIGAAAAGTALIGLGAAAIDWGKAALEDKQSADKLANTLGKIPGITQANIDANEDWITSMQLATNVADTDLRNAVGKLALATGDLTEAQKLTALAADVSAGSGKSLDTVTTALAKAVNGNTSALQRQFPWLDKNKDGAVSLDEAVTGLGGAFEGAAEKAADNDPWKRIQTIWDETKESLGNWLLPLVEKFGDWFKKKENRDNIQKVIDKLGDLSAELGTDLVNAIEDVMKWLADPKNQQKLKDWANDFLAIAKAIGQVVSGIQTLITWIDKLGGRGPNWSDIFTGKRPPDRGGWAPGYNTGGPPPPGPPGPPPPPPGATTTGPITINYHAAPGTDMRGDARTLKRLIEGDDVRQRGPAARGTPLRVAW